MVVLPQEDGVMVQRSVFSIRHSVCKSPVYFLRIVLTACKQGWFLKTSSLRSSRLCGFFPYLTYLTHLTLVAAPPSQVIVYCAQDQTYAEPIFRDFQTETGIK